MIPPGRRYYIKYPEIGLRRSETEGNAFALVGAVRRALLNAGVPRRMVEEFTAQAASGDYDKALQVCMTWVSIS